MGSRHSLAGGRVHVMYNKESVIKLHVRIPGRGPHADPLPGSVLFISYDI